MGNFIVQNDNLLTKKECAQIIEWTLKNKKLSKGKGKSGYDYCELMDYGGSFHNDLSPDALQPIKGAIDKLLDEYHKEYPEVNMMNNWSLEHIRFQWWKPGCFFDGFHSEHMKSEPHRVLVFLIYLSDNDCSTLFKRYADVETKAGRGILYPAYFTHTHSGSPCKKKLDRYLLTGYFSFPKHYYDKNI